MKRLFIFTLLLLCFNSFALAEDFALIPPNIHIEDIIEIENIGQSNLYACNNDELLLAIFVGQRGAGGAGATGGGDCYSATTMTYDGNHSSGTNYACDSAQSGIAGTNNNLDHIGTDYIGYDAVNEYISFATDETEFDDDSAFTMCVDVYIDAVSPGDAPILESYQDANNYMQLKINEISGTVYFWADWMGNTATQSAISSPVPGQSWTRCCYSVDTGSNVHATSVNGGSSWDEDAETLSTWDNGSPIDPDDITLGENLGGGTPAQAMRVRNLFIDSGYQNVTDDPY